MTKFKIGDRVVVQSSAYWNSNGFNSTMRGEVVDVTSSAVAVLIDEHDRQKWLCGCTGGSVTPVVGGFIVLKGHGGWWEFNRGGIELEEKTHLLLYSEETAMTFLQEKGYTVTPPPPKRTGKAYVYKSKSGDVHPFTEQLVNTSATLIAVVDWTEGDGMEKASETVTKPDGNF